MKTLRGLIDSPVGDDPSITLPGRCAAAKPSVQAVPYVTQKLGKRYYLSHDASTAPNTEAVCVFTQRPYEHSRTQETRG
jgi:hypothetical protein